MESIFIVYGEPISIFDHNAEIFTKLDSLNIYRYYDKNDENLNRLNLPDYLIEDIKSLDDNEKFYFTFVERVIGEQIYRYYDIVII